MDHSTTNNTPTQQSNGLQTPSSSGPQVRSRITVVCAECKRLKLKCDRKVPCGSCQKRDTVPRCVYSPAAAEKVDLHSLNNRVTTLESQMAQMGPPGSRSYNPQGAPGFPNDRALIAVGHSGSSLTIPLEDVTAIWLEHLDLNRDLQPVPSTSNHTTNASFPPFSSSTPIKLEPTPATLPSLGTNSSFELAGPALVPSASLYFSNNASPNEPTVSPELVSYLPTSTAKRRKLWNSVEDILMMNPCFNFRHFKERSEGIFKWATEADTMDSGRRNASGAPSKADTARAIFFGDASSRRSAPSRPTVSFFAAVAGALALGAQACKDLATEDLDNITGDDTAANGRGSGRRSPSVASNGPSKRSKLSGGSKQSHIPNASSTALFALSKQALDIFDETSPPDMDYLIAIILRILYMLHDGKPVVDHRLYPLVGKMTHVARMMGLSMDPDEFPGKYSLFEAETRRRVWWDVFCYDLYVSDSMGHPPSILDNSFTTKMPADVDESSFSPSTTSIPAPGPQDHPARYFGLKIRLAQLVKSVKKRSFKDPVSEASSEPSIEEASSFEGEVTHFLLELPDAFKLNIETDLAAISASQTSSESSTRPSPSACLVAQQCELTITSQRLVLKLYLPFLRPNDASSRGSASRKQAQYGSIDAAHAIIKASRILHALYRQPPGMPPKRPCPAIFDYYSFGQALFDAAVVCAHAVIQEPKAMWVETAMQDLAGALEVMKDPMVATGRGPLKGGVDGGLSEPVKIIELLRGKADSARGSSPYGTNSGSKRKHDDLTSENDQLLVGFRLPYVGASVASAGAGSTSSAPIDISAASPIFREETPGHIAPQRYDSPLRATPTGTPSEIGPKRTSDGEKGKGKDKNKKAPYPNIGIRVRTAKEPLSLTRQHEREQSTPSTPNPADVDTRMQPPTTSSQPPSLASTPAPHHQYPYSVTMNAEPSSSFPPTPSEQMLPPLQHDSMSSNQMDYAHIPVDGDYSNPPRRKPSIHEASPQLTYPSSTPPQHMYDQGQGMSYNQGTSPPAFGVPSNGASSNGSSPFSGGGALGPPVSPPYGQNLHNSTATSSYYAPGTYQTNHYDNGSQGSLVGLGIGHGSVTMDTGDAMNVSHPGGVWADIKPPSMDGPLEQAFGQDPNRGHIQSWPPSNSSNPNPGGYWQADYNGRPYPS